MPPRYEDAAAFRQSLEQRLRTAAEQRETTVNRLRLKLLIERLLGRLFAEDDPPWLVKGGYAMELRMRPRARTTKDLDLACSLSTSADTDGALAEVRDRLQDAASHDLGDHLIYRIGAPTAQIEAAPEGGARFPVVVMLAGREYGRFHVDVGMGPAPDAPPECIAGEDLLGFADLPPAQILLVSREVQYAEKLHAYTRPWVDRENTRTKDLVDLLLLIGAGLGDHAALGRALAAAFADRPGRRPPDDLPPPPESWSAPFASMAEEVGLDTTDLTAAFERLRRFHREHGGRSGAGPSSDGR